MKKILNFLLVIFFLSAQAIAANIKIMSLQNFSTSSPPKYYKAKIVETEMLKDGFLFEENSVICGEILEVVSPKRGKRDAYAILSINKVMIGPHQEKLRSPYLAKVVGYEPLNPKKVAFSLATTAAGFVVKGATQGITFIQGVAQNEEGNRLKSGVVNVYKNSPLSFIEPGEQLDVEVGDILLLIVD